MANWLIELVSSYASYDGKTKIAKGTKATIDASKLRGSSHMTPMSTNIGREAISKATGIKLRDLSGSQLEITKK